MSAFEVVCYVAEHMLLFTCFSFAGKKVWDEVAEHSKEFIQEYLEEFPNVSLSTVHVYCYCQINAL